MKILILNASPRPEGNIAHMLGAMREEAVRGGAEVCYEVVSRLHVRPCTGCMKCRSSRQCVLPADDAQRVLSLVAESDVLIVGAPCYWGNMPGTLKVLFDRMVYGLMGESTRGLPRPLHKGKRAILLTTCTTPWPFEGYGPCLARDSEVERVQDCAVRRAGRHEGPSPDGAGLGTVPAGGAR